MANGKTVRFRYAADASAVLSAARQIDAAHSKIGDSAKRNALLMSRQGDALKDVASKATMFVSLPLAAAGFAFTQMAATADETLNRVRVLFGENADAVIKWSQSAVTSLGMTSEAAQSAAATFNVFAQGAGLAAQDALNFSTAMVQLTTDMASFANTTAAEAVTAVGAALRGEFEPIRRYGVILDVATIQQEAMRLGLMKQGDELNRTARLLATQSLVLQQTTHAQGDFARTADSAANRQRVAAAAAKEQAIAFGRQLIPVLQVALGVFARALAFINGLTDGHRRAALSIAAFAFAVGPAVRGTLALVGVIQRLTAVARTASTVQAFFTAAVGGPAAIAALAAGAAAAAAFVFALNKAIDSGTKAAAAQTENTKLAMEAEAQYASLADVQGMAERATIQNTGATKKQKQELSEATKAASQFGEAMTSAFEEATSASKAFDSIVVPALEEATQAWEDAVSTVEDAQRRMWKAMQPATADDLRSAQLDVRDAQLAVEKATEKLTETLGDSEATARDAEEASIALSRAELRLRREEESLQDAQRRGTDLDADVVEARDAVRAATERLNKATVDLQWAQRGVTPEMLLDALRAQERGAHQWATSLQALSRAGIDQGILRELARLGPEGLPKVQAFFDFVNVYGASSLNGLVGNTRSALDRAMAVFPEVRPAMAAAASQTGADVGGALGGALGKAAEMNIKQSITDVFDAFRNIRALVGNIPGMLMGGPPGWNVPSTAAVDTATRMLGRQHGGPVAAGRPYIVGEAGPEWFVPSRTGTIVPGSSAGTTIVVNVAGSVIAERDLADTVRRALLDQGRRGG